MLGEGMTQSVTWTFEDLRPLVVCARKAPEVWHVPTACPRFRGLADPFVPPSHQKPPHRACLCFLHCPSAVASAVATAIAVLGLGVSVAPTTMAYPQAPPGAPKKSGHAVYGPAAAPALVGPMTHLEAILPFVWPAAQLAPKDIRNHPPSQTVLTNFGDSRIFLQMLSRRDAREGDDFRAFLEEVKAVPPPTGGYGATRLGATEYLTTEAELRRVGRASSLGTS